MQQTILYLPQHSDAAVLRTLAMHGKASLGMRVFGALDLAQFLLMRAGKPLEKRLLSQDEITLILSQLIRESGAAYFQAASFADAEALRAGLHQARMLIFGDAAAEQELICDALWQGTFPEKNAAVAAVYRAYRDWLDQNDALDSILLMRLAAAYTGKPLRVIVPETVLLSPLESQLLDAASGGNTAVVSLCELFDKADAPADYTSLTACTGISNEIRQIFARIAAENLPYGSCTVAVTDADAYGSVIREIAAEYGIPVNMRFGMPIAETAPARLLLSLLAWEQGHCGVDALTELVYSPDFKRDALYAFYPNHPDKKKPDLRRLITVCGNLRLSCDAAENSRRLADYRSMLDSSDHSMLEAFSAAEQFAAVMGKGIGAMLETFSKMRSAADGAALKLLCEMAAQCSSYKGIDPAKYIERQLRLRLGGTLPEPDRVHITLLDSVTESLRQNLFLAGLSANRFPGSTAENHLLLDDDLCLIFRTAQKDVPFMHSNDQKLLHRKHALHALLHLTHALGLHVHLSYPEYDAAELKDINAAAVLFDIYRETHPAAGFDAFRSQIRHTGYFVQPISEADAAANAYIAGKAVSPAAVQMTVDSPFTGRRDFSPTAIEEYQSCPRKFMLHILMGIQPPEKDDVFTVIAPNVLGTLLHDAFETLRLNPMTLDAFKEYVRQQLRQYFKQRPPLDPARAQRTEDECLIMAENGYNMLRQNVPVLAEESLSVLHEKSGIGLHGRFDRAEQCADGTYQMIDFKTGGTIKHTANDAASCIQTLLYAYMLSHAKQVTVSSCAYYYLQFNQIIPCNVNEENMAYVDSLLLALKESLDTGVFPPISENRKDDACKYCPYKPYCAD